MDTSYITGNMAGFEAYLAHEGVLRKSGRYPWGSGEDPHQRNKQFLDSVDGLRKKGLSETQIAEGYGMTTTQLRAAKAIAKTEQRAADASKALQLKERGMSNVAIGQQMGINESSVRALLDPAARERNNILDVTSNMLKEEVAKNRFIDIGAGTELYTAGGISKEKLNTAVAMLVEEGYTLHYVKVPQLGTGKFTTVKVLAPPDTPYREVFDNPDQIKSIAKYSEDGGRTTLGIQPPLSVSPNRVAIRYVEDGGGDADGVMYVRPGKDDISLGKSQYAQVRVKVGDSHYLKGMAMYKDDLPDGVDILFNTNKSSTGNKLDAMKKLKDDPENPFGAVVRQIPKRDKSGNAIPDTVSSAMNIVNEQGDWGNWSRTLSSQMLSKQSPRLAKDQLDLTFSTKQAQLDEIMALTNPAVKKKLLESFADDVDSSSVHLKAAALPRQRTHVILPINELKDTEIYAPNYRDGEKVVLVRFPHGGKFEIPELTVNNRNAAAKKAMGQAPDAVGINAKVAQRLSGADFDGDTVLVIPNNAGKVSTKPPLQGLKNFDPQSAYPAYEGMKPMSARTKQLKMGDVSNLITDMTIRGASDDELARAVRHSMVVIDAEKHKLNYKQSAVDNRISELKVKYQGKEGRPGTARSGASTLISQASSEVRIAERTPRPAAEGGPVDKATGKLMYKDTGESYVNAQGKTVVKTTKISKMENVDDARALSSGTQMEEVYATHANRLKIMANTARKEAISVKPTPYSPSAKKAYAPQVVSLNAKLNTALMNAPLERQAQLIANSVVTAKRQANPDLEAADIKKIKGQALTAARDRTGAGKTRVDITPDEWDAIQAGAISNNKLTSILANADVDQVKKLANPREGSVMNGPTMARAKQMLDRGYTQAEISDALGVPTSTLNSALIGEES